MSSSSSAFVDATAGAVEHCETMAQAHPDLAEQYYRPIADFCQQKLWHQLTLRVLDFVDDPRTVRTTADGVHSYLALYDKVVLRVDSKLHALSLARIASAVAHALQEDREAAKAVLENLLTKDSLGQAATIYLQSKLSLLTLKYIDPNDTAVLQQVRTLIRTNAATLNELLVDSVDQAIVHAAHFEQAMTFYKVVGPPEAFYEQAMNFLSYAPASSGRTDATRTTDYHQLGVDLCLAALTGDGVYNLQPVLDQAVIHQLKDGPEAWLVELLQACADGDVSAFAELTNKYADAIQRQPALVHRAGAVQEKLALLALVRTAFGKAAHERTLTFDEIAKSLQVPVDQVEMLIMRALSVELIKGSIDQVDGTLQVTWVMPRTLNPKQLQDLANRYGEWADRVSGTKEKVQAQTPAFA